MLEKIDDISEILDLPVAESPVAHEKLVNRFARVTQFLSWPVFFVIFHVLYRLEINGRMNFNKVRRPFVIIANHISFYDSFLFRLVLGLLTPHLPLRFMAVTSFDWKFLNFLASVGIISFIYSLFGVFTVTPGLGRAENLKKAVDIIRAGGNIVIYPEGSIIKGTELGQFKKGAADLVTRTGVPVIPVSFRAGAREWLRKKIIVNVGEPLMVAAGRDVEEVTDMFRQRTLELQSEARH